MTSTSHTQPTNSTNVCPKAAAICTTLALQTVVSKSRDSAFVKKGEQLHVYHKCDEAIKTCIPYPYLRFVLVDDGDVIFMVNISKLEVYTTHPINYVLYIDLHVK